MSCQRCRLRRHALLEVAVARNHVDVEVEEVEALPVVGRRVPLGGDRHADAVRDALAERPGGGLHAGSPPVLGVAWTSRLMLPEQLQVRQPDGFLLGIATAVREDVPHAGQVDQAVDEGGRVAAGQHEAVAVHPPRIDRVVAHAARPDGVRDGRHGHGRARVPGVRLLHAVHRNASQAIDDVIVLLRSVLVHKFPVLAAVQQHVQVDVLVSLHGWVRAADVQNGQTSGRVWELDNSPWNP
mmetsp:Transcript_4845/g.13199  ORF Transcript_4845/g.13199 Transcript_4845/m.13199 type:complete len:240 (-) Transcript_4845:7-726(-)